MAGEPADGHRQPLDRSATEGMERPVQSLELDIDGAALPGDEDAARREQREGELGELGEAADRPGGDGRPALPVAAVPGERLGPARMSLDDRGEPGGFGGGGQEPPLLGHRVDEQGPSRRESGSERDTRVSATAAEIEEAVDGVRPQGGEPGEAVDDVAEGDRGRLADRGQVDRSGPGKEQPGVIVDGAPGRWFEAQTEILEAMLEGDRVLGGQWLESVDARRERLTLVVQGPPPGVRVPCVRVAPLPASSSCAPR